MSAWLSRLVRQSRVAERSVRPAADAYRAAVFVAEAGVPPIETEVFVPARAASASGDLQPSPGTRVPPSPDATDAGARARRRAGAEARPARDAQRDAGEETLAPPRRPAPPRPPRAESEAASRNTRDPGDASARAADRAAPMRAPAGDASRLRGESSQAAIRPAAPVRVAAPPRAAGPAAEAAAPVPDVHIHIGRLELTALAAPPAPHRERAAPGHKPMSLDEYLRRRNGGGR